MDKKAAAAISDLEEKIRNLQAKHEAMVQKEKEKKLKAREKWGAQFLREFMKGMPKVCGEDFEESENAAAVAKLLLEALADRRQASQGNTEAGRRLCACARSSRRNRPFAKNSMEDKTKEGDG